MEDKTIKEAIATIKKGKKRKFSQTIDLIINLRNLDLKNPEHQKLVSNLIDTTLDRIEERWKDTYH